MEVISYSITMNRRKTSNVWRYFSALVPTLSKKFSCPECGKKYTNFYNLRQHMKKEHPACQIPAVTKPGNKRAKCEVCGESIVYSFGTTNLLRHLKRRHPPIDVDSLKRLPRKAASHDTVEGETSATTSDGQLDEEILEFLEISSKPSRVIKPAKTATKSHVSAATTNVATTNTTSQHKRKTLSLPAEQATTVVVERKPLQTQKKKFLDQLLVEAIVDHYLPYDLVENEKFRKFVRELNASYELPTCKTLTTDLVPMAFRSLKEKVVKELRVANTISLTTDSWTSDDGQSYVSVTAHFISDSCDLKSYLLGCFLDSHHTTENMFSEIQRILQEFNCEHKVSGITTDNTASSVNTASLYNWLHFPSYAHTLNELVQEAISLSLDDTLNITRNVVQYFLMTTHANLTLKSIQQQMELPQLDLKEDVPSQWETIYEMFRRMYLIKDAINSAVEVMHVDLPLPTSEKWTTMKYVTDVLKKFKQLTVELSKENDVTLSKVGPLSTVLLTHIRQYQDDGWYPQDFINFIKIIETGIQKRAKSMFESNDLLKQAILLDPRFKKDGFESEIYFEEATIRILNKAKRVFVESAQNSTIEDVPTFKDDMEDNEEGNIWSCFDKKVSHLVGDEDPASAVTVELQNYLRAPLLRRVENPLKWWKQYKGLYPHLFQVAQTILSIKAIAVPCKRSLPLMSIKDNNFEAVAEVGGDVVVQLFLKNNL